MHTSSKIYIHIDCFEKITVAICIVFLSMVIGGGCSKTYHSKTKLGDFKIQEFSDGMSYLHVNLNDGSTVTIEYYQGEAIFKCYDHPEGHYLNGRIRPLCEKKVLDDLTDLYPTFRKIAQGKEEISSIIENSLCDFPPYRYELPFDEEPGKYKLRINGNLFFRDYKSFVPNAKIPYLAYWGAEGKDETNDDLIYCGYWQLDKNKLNLPIIITSESVYKVSEGDTIRFDNKDIAIIYIDHDNNGIPWDNIVYVEIHGEEDLSQIIQSTAGAKPIQLDEYITVISGKNINIGKNNIISFPKTIKATLMKEVYDIAHAKTEQERGGVIKGILLNGGYQEHDINISDNGYIGSEDIWIHKKGKSNQVVIFTAHYDKAGSGSQGVHDNGCAVVMMANLAVALRNINTNLSYIFLFYGAHEFDGHSYTKWLNAGHLRQPIASLIQVGGGGLIDAEETYELSYARHNMYLYWQYPKLRINETGGPSNYLKHTSADNIMYCDYSRLTKSQNTLLEIINKIEMVSHAFLDKNSSEH